MDALFKQLETHEKMGEGNPAYKERCFILLMFNSVFFLLPTAGVNISVTKGTFECPGTKETTVGLPVMALIHKYRGTLCFRMHSGDVVC